MKYFILFFSFVMTVSVHAQTENKLQKRKQDSLKLEVLALLKNTTKKEKRIILRSVLKEYPENKQPKTPADGWNSKGKINVLINQSVFNTEWSGGGTNNIAGSVVLRYDLNYKRRNWSWDNQFRFAYGLSKLQDNSDFRKTDDILEVNSILGIKARKNWYYSAFSNLKTQLDTGYQFDKEGNRTETSHGFSPAYVQLGLGGLWKKNDRMKTNISPLAGRLIFVHKHFTLEKSVYGVDQGEGVSLEFGASIEGYFKFLIGKKLSIEHLISLYSNYLEKPWNIDMNYTMNATLPITKNLNSTLAFQAIYDDDTVSGFQIREVFAIGLNFNF